MSGRVTIRPVRGRADMSRFLRFPWRLYRGDRAWVPQLMAYDKKVLGAGGPFLEHAEGEVFLAERDGEPVGRITAAVDRLHTEEGLGTFGYFESIDDESVARALLEAAEEWLAARGVTLVRGPVSPSTNLGPPGIYIEGDDTRPGPLMPHHPPYYARLVEAAGYLKDKDLFAMRGETKDLRIDEGLARIPEFEAQGYRFRLSTKKTLVEDIKKLGVLRNHVYGSVGHYMIAPITDAEIELLTHEFKPLLDPRLFVFVEREEKTLGAVLAIPDITRVLQVLDGRLGPIRLIRALLAGRRIDGFQVRDFLMDPAEKTKFLSLTAAQLVLRNGRDNGYRRAEYCWIVENNIPTLFIWKRVGGRIAKRYRMYEKQLGRGTMAADER